MSYDESYRHRHPCPCGAGEYEEVGLSGDWGSSQTQRTMLCTSCAPEYVWSHTSLGGHKWNESERGWLRRSVVEAEDRYRRAITERLREQLAARWHEAFATARTKKAKWAVLTAGGKGYPSLGTFYEHTKGMNGEALAQHINGYLSFSYLGRVEEICGVLGEDLGVRGDRVCEVCGRELHLNGHGDLMCSSCRYIRPRPSF